MKNPQDKTRQIEADDVLQAAYIPDRWDRGQVPGIEAQIKGLETLLHHLLDLAGPEKMLEIYQKIDGTTELYDRWNGTTTQLTAK